MTASPLQTSTFQEMSSSARFWEQHHLLSFLVKTRLILWTRTRALGLLWWLLEPLALTFTYIILVKLAFRGGTPQYALFLMCAVLPWQWFNSAVNAAANSLKQNVQIMKSVRINYLLMPTSEVLAATVRFLMAMPIFAFLLLWYQTPPTWQLLWLPVILLVQFLVTLAIGFWLSVATVYLSDTMHLWSILMRVWFFLSPSLYDIDRIPEKFISFYMLNPFAVLFTAYRSVFINGSMPDLYRLSGVTIAALIVMFAGQKVIRRQEGLITRFL